ncbi:MAG: hypothetical protein ACI9S8_002868, partial [Chlamydiales bacterium]
VDTIKSISTFSREQVDLYKDAARKLKFDDKFKLGQDMSHIASAVKEISPENFNQKSSLFKDLFTGCRQSEWLDFAQAIDQISAKNLGHAAPLLKDLFNEMSRDYERFRITKIIAKYSPEQLALFIDIAKMTDPERSFRLAEKIEVIDLSPEKLTLYLNISKTMKPKDKLRLSRDIATYPPGKVKNLIELNKELSDEVKFTLLKLPSKDIKQLLELSNEIKSGDEIDLSKALKKFIRKNLHTEEDIISSTLADEINLSLTEAINTTAIIISIRNLGKLLAKVKKPEREEPITVVQALAIGKDLPQVINSIKSLEKLLVDMPLHEKNEIIECANALVENIRTDQETPSFKRISESVLSLQRGVRRLQKRGLIKEIITLSPKEQRVKAHEHATNGQKNYDIKIQS